MMEEEEEEEEWKEEGEGGRCGRVIERVFSAAKVPISCAVEEEKGEREDEEEEEEAEEAEEEAEEEEVEKVARAIAPQEEAKKRMLRKSMTEERGEREPVYRSR